MDESAIPRIAHGRVVDICMRRYRRETLLSIFPMLCGRVVTMHIVE